MADNKLDVRVYPIYEPKGSTVAFASVAVDDLVAIRGIRVVDGEKGKFVTMPQSKSEKEDGKVEYHDIAHPINGDLRKDMSAAVLDEYKRVAALSPEERGYEAPDMSAVNNKRIEDIKLDIRVYPLDDPKGSTKAFASVAVDDVVIRGVRVVDGEKGLFVTMPQSKSEKEEGKVEYHDIAFPLNGDLRKEISKAILDEYKAAEKSVDRKQTLADGLAAGVARAAEHTAAPRDAAAKSHGAGVLE
jgi:stage V sporulation protein G